MTGGHPAPFPVELARRAIRLSTWPGEVVFDPFAGTGSTLVAARQLGRRAVGVEALRPLLRARCRPARTDRPRLRGLRLTTRCAPGRPGVQTVRPGACPLDGGRRGQPYDHWLGRHALGGIPLRRDASSHRHRAGRRDRVRRVRHELRRRGVPDVRPAAPPPGRPRGGGGDLLGPTGVGHGRTLRRGRRWRLVADDGPALRRTAWATTSRTVGHGESSSSAHGPWTRRAVRRLAVVAVVLSAVAVAVGPGRVGHRRSVAAVLVARPRSRLAGDRVPVVSGDTAGAGRGRGSELRGGCRGSRGVRAGAVGRGGGLPE